MIENNLIKQITKSYTHGMNSIKAESETVTMKKCQSDIHTLKLVINELKSKNK